jgi:cytoskeletal protein CcmA (bactofilin family)
MFIRKADRLKMVLGENSKITGDVESPGTILVEGTILGNVQGEKVIMGEKAYIRGDISANCISIAGKIEGHLLGTESIKIKSTAKITGDIFTKSIYIMDGAIFNGTCRMDNALSGRGVESDKNVIEFGAAE